MRHHGSLLQAAALSALLVALLTVDALLRANGHTWWRLMPESILLRGIDYRSGDARDELTRRARTGSLSAESARELIVRAVGMGVYELDDSVATIALADAGDRSAFLARFFNVSLNPTFDWELATPAPYGSVQLRIANNSSKLVATFVRVEAVRIDGVAATWSLVRDVGASFDVGHRVLLDMGILRCLAPAPLLSTGSTVEVEVTLGLGPYTPGVPFDPLIDPAQGLASTTPDEWCVPITTITRTIKTTLPLPSLPSSESSQP